MAKKSKKTPREFVTFGEFLKKWRKGVGIPQDDLAKKIGYKDGTAVSHFEQGQRPLPIDRVPLLVFTIFSAYQKRDQPWRATEAREAFRVIGYDWKTIRDSLAKGVRGHTEEKRKEVLQWWDSAKPFQYWFQYWPRFPTVPQEQVERDVISDLVGKITATKKRWYARWPIVVVWGPPGIGKTTATYQACRTAEVKSTFPDGIVWIQPREEAGRSGREGRLRTAEEMALYACLQVGIQRPERLGWLEAWKRWVSLRERRVLLVLDPVNNLNEWEVAQFLTESLSERSVVVIVTRNRVALKSAPHLLSDKDAAFVEVTGLTEKEGMELVHVLEPNELPTQEELKAVLALTGGHPVALRVVTSIAAEHNWQAAITQVKETWDGWGASLERLFATHWYQVDRRLRERLLALLKGGVADHAFGLGYAMAVWGNTKDKAKPWLSQLCDVGLLEAVKSPSYVKPTWRVLPAFWRARETFLHPVHVSFRKRMVLARRVRAHQPAELQMPWPLRLMISFWWMVGIIPTFGGYHALRAIAALVRKDWHLKWRSLWCLAPLQPRLFEKWFRGPTWAVLEDELLLYRWHQWWGNVWSTLMIGALVFTLSVAMGWLPSQLTVGVVISGPLFLVAFFAMAWLAAWRTWLAYLHGMETPDLKVILHLAERLRIWKRPQSTPSATSETQEEQGGDESSEAGDGKEPLTGSTAEREVEAIQEEGA